MTYNSHVMQAGWLTFRMDFPFNCQVFQMFLKFLKWFLKVEHFEYCSGTNKDCKSQMA